MKKTLRIVFACLLAMTASSAMAEDIIWQEDFSGAADLIKVDPTTYNSNYTFGGTVLNEDGSFKSGTAFYNEALAGGTAPELLVARNGGFFSANINLGGKSGDMVLTFKSNKNLTVTAEGATLGDVVIAGNDYTYPVTVAPGTSNITITFTWSQSSNARLDNIKLYQGNALKPAGLSWGKASTTLTLGEEVTLKLSNENNLPVAYTSSNEEVATISADGNITLVAAGKTTFTATFDGNDEYEAQTVSIDVTVKDNSGEEPGTGTDPTTDVLTVAQALDIINSLTDNKATSEEYEVKGYVVGTPDWQRKADGTLYGNVNFDIADVAGGTDKITVFRAKNFDNASFTEETINNFKEGDIVVVHGKLQNYKDKNGITTPEIANGYLISISNATTAISSIRDINESTAVYNLRGQRVENAQKGIFIVGGKKIVK